MSDQQHLYRVEMLDRAPDGAPLWGVRRPDGSWCRSMAKPAWYIGRRTAEHDAADLNRYHGLTSDGS
ncbi:hypothetical protein OU787_19850 [Kitasatospora sp. YST-16]|uniref:hypothetical protein n=1 Tax=Kitasatospora sp. YST-16 TaxID=2998080 RepID=UPI002283A9B7|nr:hypothetical protein [Kitasatospora sp. YST-16]WAL73564.1 hypothetical protein OU787_19850 [Kitasatospora sp. YST-16]WNW39621.1 hypothetical protein RKE32_19790 [Streptomyces sp. Li-HN-5-13]